MLKFYKVIYNLEIYETYKGDKLVELAITVW